MLFCLNLQIFFCLNIYIVLADTETKWFSLFKKYYNSEHLCLCFFVYTSHSRPWWTSESPGEIFKKHLSLRLPQTNETGVFVVGSEYRSLIVVPFPLCSQVWETSVYATILLWFLLYEDVLSVKLSLSVKCSVIKIFCGVGEKESIHNQIG